MILSNGNLSKNKTGSQADHEKHSRMFLTLSKSGMFSLMFRRKSSFEKQTSWTFISLEKVMSSIIPYNGQFFQFVALNMWKMQILGNYADLHHCILSRCPGLSFYHLLVKVHLTPQFFIFLNECACFLKYICEKSFGFG